MSELMLFWLAKYAVDLALCLLILVAAILFAIPRALRQSRCEHEKVSETQACDAICCACGKNLGFIGAWRAKKGGAA